MRVCDAALEVLVERGKDAVQWGDTDLLDAIAKRAGLPAGLWNTSEKVLNCLSVKPGWLVPGKIEVVTGTRPLIKRTRLVRIFRLPEMGQCATFSVIDGTRCTFKSSHKGKCSWWARDNPRYAEQQGEGTMKINASGAITALVKREHGDVDVAIEFTGKAADVASTAKEVKLGVSLQVKGLVAEQLKYGQKLYLTVSSEPPNEAPVPSPTLGGRLE